RHHVLISTADVGKRGGMMCSFPLPAFEEAMLSLLQEIDPAELLPPRGEANEVVTLSAEVAAIEARIGELEAELEEGGDVPALARVLRRLEAQKKETGARLAEARLRASSPALEAWGEMRTLAQVVAAADDPEAIKLRLRAVLRRVIDEIRLVVVKKGMT